MNPKFQPCFPKNVFKNCYKYAAPTGLGTLCLLSATNMPSLRDVSNMH
ncbi:Uncharacterized protein dnm_063470 [Desulfonema magnum]|uniref:Uncharacterized protein n=1 Tax=Desulfonema magnum TaxID=45655 RepID=A0A975BRC4_9BACT|nr:Uncharacterized protein dnm_063470 [Desulfonema magnum]